LSSRGEIQQHPLTSITYFVVSLSSVQIALVRDIFLSPIFLSILARRSLLRCLRLKVHHFSIPPFSSPSRILFAPYAPFCGHPSAFVSLREPSARCRASSPPRSGRTRPCRGRRRPSGGPPQFGTLSDEQPMVRDLFIPMKRHYNCCVRSFVALQRRKLSKGNQYGRFRNIGGDRVAASG
jgi:hypothetical protein